MINAENIYQIQINPFRTEWATNKSDCSPAQLCLLSNVVIQIEKEIFIGPIIKIKSSLKTTNDYEQSKLTRLSPRFGEAGAESKRECHIIRLAAQDDLTRKQALNKRNDETKQFFEYLLKKYKLLAKVVLVDWDISQHKVYCYVTSERKVNYLLLHETAVDTLKARVAIKQVGVRDFARSIGGLGICGRELCCRAFLNNIQSITLTTVRQQNIYVEPDKISGCCGKLRCCMVYEQHTSNLHKQEQTE